MTAAIVLLYALLAVIPAGIGAYLGVRRLGTARGQITPGATERVLAWANASAAGLMFGIAYGVLTAGAALSALGGTVGAALGVTLVHLLGHYTAAPRLAARALVASALHSASEGVAIGAATALNPTFGLFLVLTFAVHNVSEGALVGAAVAWRGRGAWSIAQATMMARLGQPALAAVTIVIVRVAPSLQPWALGAAAGALVYLVLAELLPSSYRLTGRTSIAVTVSVAAGIVALLGGRTR